MAELLQAAVCAIAIWRVFGLFAHAQVLRATALRLKNQRFHPGSRSVCAVTQGLAFGKATRTPGVIFVFFQFHGF